MSKLREQIAEKTKNIETSPSLISEDYVYAVFRCVCCRRKFGRADYRKEDMAEMLKSDKPLCGKCAKFLRQWKHGYEEKLQELQGELLKCHALGHWTNKKLRNELTEAYENWLENFERKFVELRGKETAALRRTSKEKRRQK